MAPKRKASGGNTSQNNKAEFLMILSPAKTLNLSPLEKDQPIPWTSPKCSDEKTQEIMKAMKEHAKDATKLSKLLGISAKLAGTAKTYWDEMSLDASEASTLKPCGFAFSGAAYQGLQIDTMSVSGLEYLQESLRIVDPLYGFLKPMDAIQPYRLEMATRNVLKDTKNKDIKKLVDYWKNPIFECTEKSKNKVILNLASDEYSAAVDALMIKFVFWTDGRNVSVNSKRARGLMARYLAENNMKSVGEIKKFTEEGYTFKPQDSDDTTIVFDRPKNWKKTRTAKSWQTHSHPLIKIHS